MLTDYFDLPADENTLCEGYKHMWDDVKLKHHIFDIPAGTVFDHVAIDYLEGKITLYRDAQVWEFLIKPVFLTVPK